MPASKIAEAYVQIIPRIEGMTAGIKSELDDKIQPVIDKAGKDGGKKFGLAFEEGTKDLNKRIDKLFKSIGVAALAAGAGIAVFAKSSIGEASKLEESINAVNVSYGEAAKAVLAIGETSAKSLGVARSEFNAAAVRFSAFAERVVGEGGDVAGFIGDVTTRAADFASVFNIDVSEALQVFQSGLSGEAEPLKRFGINLLESEVKAYALRAGIIAVGEEMTEQEKVQARYGLLMESTAKTAGDFANTSDSLANKQRILQATFTDLQGRVGNAFLPVMGQLVTLLADFLLPKLEAFGAYLQSPEGKQAVDDFGNAIKNILTAGFNFLDFISRNRDVLGLLATSLLGGVAAFRIYTATMGIANAIHIAFTGTTLAGVAATNALSVALKALPFVAIASLVVLVITAIVQLATQTTFFQDTWKVMTKFAIDAWNNVVRFFEDTIDWFANNWQSVLSWIIFPVFNAIQLIIDNWDKINKFFADSMKAIGEFFTNGWNAIVKFVQDSFKNIGNFVADGVNKIANFFAELPKKVLEFLKEAPTWLYETGVAMIQGLLDGAKSLLKDIGKFFLDLLPSWIRDPFKEALGIASPSKVFYNYGENIGQGLVNGIESSTSKVEAAAKKLSKAAVPPGFEWVMGPNGPYLEMKSFTSGQSDKGVADFGAASASFLLRQEGFSQNQIDRILTNAVGGTLDQVNATMNRGVTLVNKATNTMAMGNFTDANVAEKIAEGFTVVEKIASPIEDLEKSISDLVSTIQRGGAASLLTPFASGGVVTGPTAALIGEAGPEVVMPLDRFESIMGISEKQQGTINYYAAPNQSIDSEQALFQAMRRAKVVAQW